MTFENKILYKLTERDIKQAVADYINKLHRQQEPIHEIHLEDVFVGDECGAMVITASKDINGGSFTINTPVQGSINDR